MLISSVYTVYTHLQSSRIPGTNDVTGYLLLHIALTWILLFSSHSQIALRTLGGNPFFWWGLAQRVWRINDGGVKLTGPGKVWIGWAFVWSLTSLVLWAGFYPPA